MFCAPQRFFSRLPIDNGFKIWDEISNMSFGLTACLCSANFSHYSELSEAQSGERACPVLLPHLVIFFSSRPQTLPCGDILYSVKLFKIPFSDMAELPFLARNIRLRCFPTAGTLPGNQGPFPLFSKVAHSHHSNQGLNLVLGYFFFLLVGWHLSIGYGISSWGLLVQVLSVFISSPACGIVALPALNFHTAFVLRYGREEEKTQRVDRRHGARFCLWIFV